MLAVYHLEIIMVFTHWTLYVPGWAQRSHRISVRPSYNNVPTTLMCHKQSRIDAANKLNEVTYLTDEFARVLDIHFEGLKACVLCNSVDSFF